MNLFLDCEFNGFNGDLISMALVAEDGREWYEVVPCRRPKAWVAEHVIPILGRRALPSRRALTMSLSTFLGQFDSIHVVAGWPEDLVHFCDALIAAPGYCINTPALTLQIFDVDATSAQPHNALADARALREAVMAASAS